MAKQTNVNLAPATGAVAMFNLLEFLRVQMGFTITLSGDGLAAFDNTGIDVFTNGGNVGANGMDNNDAWFVAQDPLGAYEWLFQRNTSSVSWEVLVCKPSDTFAGGSSTVRATSASEQQLINTTMFPSDGTYRQHLVGFDVAEAGVYAWHMTTSAGGTGEPRTWLMHESLDPASYPALSGTVAVPVTGEADPSVYMASYSTAGASFITSTNAGNWNSLLSSPAKAWYCMNGTNGQTEAFTNYHLALHMNYGSSAFVAPAISVSDGIGPDPRDGNDAVMTGLVNRYAGDSTLVGSKGIMKNVRLRTIQSRDYPDTVDVAGERFVHMKEFVLPFGNGVTPLV